MFVSDHPIFEPDVAGSSRHIGIGDPGNDKDGWMVLENSISTQRQFQGPFVWVGGRGHNCRYYRVPPELLAAFLAGEDWRPCVDWLAETYPDLDWLGRLVAEASA